MICRIMGTTRKRFCTTQRQARTRWILFSLLVLLLTEEHHNGKRVFATVDDNSSIDTSNQQTCRAENNCLQKENQQSDDSLNIILIKIGGSSITDKSTKETLNETALTWFGRTIAQSISPEFLNSETNKDRNAVKVENNSIDDTRRRNAYIIVHGAGSFGHHTAKEYGLKGGSGAKKQPKASNEQKINSSKEKITNEQQLADRKLRHGIAETRLSVQKLNHAVVSTLLDHQINAIGISPCFAIPGVDPNGVSDSLTEFMLQHSILYRSVQAGIVPVLHGDACLYSNSFDKDPSDIDRIGGILSGDTLMEIIGTSIFVNQVIFITDVDGVYNQDPKTNPDAQLIRTISVNTKTGDIDNISLVDAAGSSHAHDVTGGLKTKLASAASIVATSGTNVTIVRCGTPAAEYSLAGKVLSQGDMADETLRSTTLYAS